MKENIATYSRFYYIAGYCDRFFFPFWNSKMRYEKCETRDFSMWLHWCIAMSSVEICAELNWAFGRDRKIQCSHTNGFIIYNFSLLFAVFCVLFFWISFFCCFNSVYFLSAFFPCNVSKRYPFWTPFIWMAEASIDCVTDCAYQYAIQSNPMAQPLTISYE